MLDYVCMKTAAGASLTAYIDGELKTLTHQHPNFDEVLQVLESQDPDGDPIDEAHLIDLIDEKVTAGVNRTLRTLVDGVTFDEDSNQLFFKDEPVHGTIREHIAQRLADGSSDWKPLAKFLQNLGDNPSYHSREQLYDWLVKTGVTITPDGEIIAYKGLTADGFSGHAGGAFVDGTWVDGQVPNEVGTTISLDRTKIDDDHTRACSYGLHAGSWDYAQSYHQGRMATVLINPADFVSVPRDGQGEKCRVSRYTVESVMIGNRAKTQVQHRHIARNSVVDPSELSRRNPLLDVFPEDKGTDD